MIGGKVYTLNAGHEAITEDGVVVSAGITCITIFKLNFERHIERRLKY